MSAATFQKPDFDRKAVDRRYWLRLVRMQRFALIKW